MLITRRTFAGALTCFGITSVPVAGRAEGYGTAVAEIRTALNARREAGGVPSNDWVLLQIRNRLSGRDALSAAHELVANTPYLVSRWTGDPNELFAIGKGDCRHKAAALTALLRGLDQDAAIRLVVFDWADLPIPAEILSIFPDTRSIHDCVEVQIDGDAVLVDATWDAPLASAGFPHTWRWDGVSATVGVTTGRTTLVDRDILGTSGVYETYGIPRPVLQTTQTFNRAFNEWLDNLRLSGGEPS